MGLNLAATISLDGSQFERGMMRVGQSVSSTIKGFVAGAVGVYAIQAAFRKTIDTADELVNASKRLNITVEQLQVLQQAAKDSGTELDAVTTALEKLGQAQAMAKGMGLSNSPMERTGYSSMFSQLGVSGQQMQTMNAGQLLLGPIAQKIRDTADPQTLIEPIRTIFGRAGGQLIPLLKSDIGGLGEQMKQLGAIMSTDTAVKLKDMKDKFSLISTIMVSALGPTLLNLARVALTLADAFVSLINWINQKTGVGNASATFGALQGQLGTAKTFEYLAEILKEKATGTLDVAALDKKYGLDRDAMEKGAKAGVTAGFENISALQKAIEDSLKALNLPAKPTTGISPMLEPDNRATAKRLAGDSNELIRTGNFLGASRDAIGELQKQATMHAATTANNTTQMVRLLESWSSRNPLANINPASNFRMQGVSFPAS